MSVWLCIKEMSKYECCLLCVKMKKYTIRDQIIYRGLLFGRISVTAQLFVTYEIGLNFFLVLIHLGR